MRHLVRQLLAAAGRLAARLSCLLRHKALQGLAWDPAARRWARVCAKCDAGSPALLAPLEPYQRHPAQLQPNAVKPNAATIWSPSRKWRHG
jgi:hypothetical protein